MTKRPIVPIHEKSVYFTKQKHHWDSNGAFSNIILQLLLIPIAVPYIVFKKLFKKG